MLNQPIIKILSQNLQHARSATQQMIINACDTKASVICIQEPYLANINRVCGIPLKYKIFSDENTNNSPKCAIVTSHQNSLLISQFTTSTCVCVEFNFDIPFIICSVYYSRNLDNINEELDHLEGIIKEFPNKAIIITGDFNGWHTAWGSENNDERGRKIYNFCCANQLILLNDGITPTFEINERSSFIDLTIVNAKALKFVKNWKVEDVLTCSDHRLVSLDWQSESAIKTSLTRKYCTSKVDWHRFVTTTRKEIGGLNEKVKHLNSGIDINRFTVELTDSLIEICERSLPIKKQNTKNVYWITEHIIAMKHRVNNLRRQYQRQNHPILRQRYRDSYIEILKNYKIELKITKRNAIRDFYSNQDNTTIWSKVYSWCKTPSRLNNDLKTIRTDSGWTENLDETANHLLDKFFPDENTNNHNMVQEEIQKRAKKDYFAPDDCEFTCEEVQKAIDNENDSKSPGWDGISASIIKQCSYVFPSLFHNLYNKCLKFGTFPRVWKNSVVKVIPKHGSTSQDTAKAYRPISLLPVMGKLLEKLLNDRLSYFLHQIPNGIAYRQFGFTPQKSAEEAIMEVVRRQDNILKNKTYGFIVSLDITGAFDNAWWDLIIVMLKRYKVPGNLLRIMQNYFSERKATLPLGGKEYSKNLTRGCPQGAKCSPLLWNVLYSDMLNLNLPTGCYLQGFADDAILCVEGNSLETALFRVNTALESIVNWGNNCKLTFNPSKTQVMLISRKNKITQSPQITMNGEVVELVKEMKYLGIIIDTKLKWNKHVTYICSKAKRILHQILRTTGKKWGVSGDLLRLLYTNAIEPLISYGSRIWINGLENSTIKRTLISTQRSFAIMIIKGYRSISAEAALVLANLMPLDIKLRMTASKSDLRAGVIPSYIEEIQNKEMDGNGHHLELGHPAQHKKCLYGKCNGVHVLEVFTDGSKLEGSTGCSFVVYENGINIYEKTARLANYCTVFQAEILAIDLAIDWINNSNKHARINSDSESALKVINGNSKYKMAIKCRNKIRESNIHICLKWTKAHVGTIGNEKADELAKLATRKEIIEYDKVPISYVMNYIRNLCVQNWQTRWDNSTKGKTTKHFISSISNHLKLNYIPEFIETQFLSGHGGFKEYLFNRKIIRDNLCICGGIESAVHLVEDCIEMENLRYEYRLEQTHLQRSNNTFDMNHLNKYNLNNFKIFIKNIYRRL